MDLDKKPIIGLITMEPLSSRSRKSSYGSNNTNYSPSSIQRSASNILSSCVPSSNQSLMSEVPNDMETMRSVIEDLSRRLQNAQHTIVTQKEIARVANEEAEQYKAQYFSASRQLRLELARNENMERRHKLELESKRSEDSNIAIENLKHEIRLLTVDQQMTKSKLKLTQLQGLKEKLRKLEKSQESQMQLIMHLKSQDEAIESLCKACQLGDTSSCAALIEQGVCVNGIDTAGFLPIHYACSYGLSEIVKLLLDANSDPGSYLTRKNPMEIAGRYGHYRLIPMLKEYGGDVDDAGTGGTAPLLSAVAGGYLLCVKELLDLGADIHVRDKLSNNCLHIAAALQDAGHIINLLLQHGADISATNIDGYSPLQLATSKSNYSAIDALRIAAIKPIIT